MSPRRDARTRKNLVRLIVPRKKLDKPKFWIVAGPNGSGKSSIYTDTDIEDFGGSVWIINPDLLTARIRETERLRPTAANIAAVTRIYDWLETSIAAYQTIGVETVLSTEKYRALVLAAKAHGFEGAIDLHFAQFRGARCRTREAARRKGRPRCADKQNSRAPGAFTPATTVVSPEFRPCMDI